MPESDLPLMAWKIIAAAEKATSSPWNLLPCGVSGVGAEKEPPIFKLDGVEHAIRCTHSSDEGYLAIAYPDNVRRLAQDYLEKTSIDWKAAFHELVDLTLSINKGSGINSVPDLDVDIASIITAHARAES
jgi:hypothetical protein